jgi:hypothetical protein
MKRGRAAAHRLSTESCAPGGSSCRASLSSESVLSSSSAWMAAVASEDRLFGDASNQSALACTSLCYYSCTQLLSRWLTSLSNSCVGRTASQASRRIGCNYWQAYSTGRRRRSRRRDRDRHRSTTLACYPSCGRRRCFPSPHPVLARYGSIGNCGRVRKD